MIVTKRSPYFLIFVFILTGLTFYYFVTRYDMGKPNLVYVRKSVSKAYLVDTPGCRIPYMEPFDEILRIFMYGQISHSCHDIPPLVESNQTSIWIAEKALKSYNVVNFSELYCCYSKVWRPFSSENDIDDSIEISNNCTLFYKSAQIPFEFIKVKCKVKKKLIYMDFHAFIVPKAIDPQIKKSKLSNNPDDTDLSVLIIGEDSVSRLSFHRIMPKTKNLLNFLGAIEFLGYNKVQDNTFPNLVSVFTGYAVEEIGFCWPDRQSYFDDCPWIWKNFSENGFVTGWGEDATWMSIFNYLKSGFKKPPVDYYARPYIYASEKFIGNFKVSNTPICSGNRYSAEVLFDYASKFILNMTLSNRKFWGFFWEASMTHDNLNGHLETDNTFYNFFKKLQEENVFNKTVVFFISDHGMRWGDFRSTYQGRMEEHLPFLFLIVPQWFKERYSSAMLNLQRNTRLLTTPYDLHETLKDFLNLDKLKPENLEKRAVEAVKQRGSSLFLPVSMERTCESVGIKPSWCTCQDIAEVSVTDVLVKKAALVAVEYINILLKDLKQCAKLRLSQIISAHTESLNKKVKSDSTGVIINYVIIFQTEPGFGKFESVVRYQTDSHKLIVASDVSRINAYGNQSQCISDYQLKLYCYCL